MVVVMMIVLVVWTMHGSGCGGVVVVMVVVNVCHCCSILSIYTCNIPYKRVFYVRLNDVHVLHGAEAWSVISTNRAYV